MNKLLYASALVLVLVLSLAIFGQQVLAQADSPTPVPQVAKTGSAGQIIPGDPNALTSFTISNPYCFQPDPAVDQCYINFRYVQAVDNQSSSPFMTWLAINISSKNRFTATAFFEGVITYSYDMNPGGLKVPCGLPNAGGAGNLYGNSFGVVVSPLDSNHSAMSTDIANVTCPAFAP